MDDTEIFTKLCDLRKNFLHEFTKCKSNPTYVSDWKYYDMLKFLAPSADVSAENKEDEASEQQMIAKRTKYVS